MSKLVHTLHGTAKDIETVVRLRPWMEEEVKSTYPNFRKTKLVTDYDAESTIFSFKILFFK
jgi:hypothetical protein